MIFLLSLLDLQLKLICIFIYACNACNKILINVQFVLQETNKGTKNKICYLNIINNNI